MNDEFLTQFREAPRAEFANALYERISQQPQPHFSWKIVNKLTLRNAAAMLVLMLLVAACVYAVVEKRWNKVGDIWVNVQIDPELPQVEISYLCRAPVADLEVANLVEAKAALKFEFMFPSWAPEGFALRNRMNIFSPWSEKSLSAFWESQDGGDPIGICLDYRWYEVPGTINPMYENVATGMVAPGSFKEVEVQGHPAVLVRGDWNWYMQPVEGEPQALQWDENFGLSLYWTDENVSYRLWTYNPAVSAKDLIEMAESAK